MGVRSEIEARRGGAFGNAPIYGVCAVALLLCGLGCAEGVSNLEVFGWQAPPSQAPIGMQPAAGMLGVDPAAVFPGQGPASLGVPTADPSINPGAAFPPAGPSAVDTMSFGTMPNPGAAAAAAGGACPNYQGQVSGMAVDLPGCCMPERVCGVVSSLTDMCITSSRLLPDLAPGGPC